MYFTATTDQYASITLADEKTKLRRTLWREKLSREHSLGIYQSLTVQKIGPLSGYLEYDLSYDKVKSREPDLVPGNESLNFFASIKNQISIGERLKGEVDF